MALTGIEVLRKIVAEKRGLLIRLTSWPEPAPPFAYDVKPLSEMPDLPEDAPEGANDGWVIFDLFSASIAVQIHDGLNEKNRAKFAAMDLVGMVRLALQISNHIENGESP
jgi:hypothetical protein